MPQNQFKLLIGAKRQLTLPAELLKQLQIPDRGELLVEIIGDHAVITPMVSMPRTQLPENLRRTFESRRGAQPSDIPLGQFLEEVGYQEGLQMTGDTPLPSWQERYEGLTPNERVALERRTLAALPQPLAPNQQGLTEREKQVLDQIVRSESNQQIAHTLGVTEPAVKPYVSKIEQMLGKLTTTAQDEARSQG